MPTNAESRTDVLRDSGALGSLTNDAPTNGVGPAGSGDPSEQSAATSPDGASTSTAGITNATANYTGDSNAVDSGMTQDTSSSQGQAEVSVEHCSPGTPVDIYGGQKPLAVDCRPSKDLLIPNVSNAWIDSVKLPEPMRKGEP